MTKTKEKAYYLKKYPVLNQCECVIAPGTKGVFLTPKGSKIEIKLTSKGQKELKKFKAESEDLTCKS